MDLTILKRVDNYVQAFISRKYIHPAYNGESHKVSTIRLINLVAILFCHSDKNWSSHESKTQFFGST